MSDKDTVPAIFNPAELFRADPLDDALAAQAAGAPGIPPVTSPALASEFPKCPLGASLEQTRAAFEWASLVAGIHGVMAMGFIQGRMIEAANAMDLDKYVGWDSIGHALSALTRPITDDEIIH